MTLSIGIGQVQTFPGQLDNNGEALLHMLDRAERDGLPLVVFPELAVTGYLLGDTWERDTFLRECEAWNQRIIASSNQTLVVFGTQVTDWEKCNEDGRPRKYNALIAAQNGKALTNPATGQSFFIKTLHPNYREFDDSRHFYDLRQYALEQKVFPEDLLEPLPIPSLSLSLGLTLCEDGWSRHYARHPLRVLRNKGADLIINASCSPFTLEKINRRQALFSQWAKDLHCRLLYVNNTGVQNNGKTLFSFDGSSTLYDAEGKTLFETPAFSPGFYTTRVDATPDEPSGKMSSEEELFSALRFSLKELLEEQNIQRVVVGVSGGIDSAVSAALFRSILPPEQLLLINMPSAFNSNTTIQLAKELARNLESLYLGAPIDKSVALTKEQLNGKTAVSLSGKHQVQLHLTDFQLENVQARDRSGRLLAAAAAAFGGVFTCNANKAELAVGYGTLYGDLAGFLAPLGDLWKHQVYALGEYLNQHIFKKEMIPKEIFKLPPSAELSPQQNIDKGQGDPLHYPYHDRLFYSWIQRWRRATPTDNLEWYAAGRLVEELGCPEVNLGVLFPAPKDFVDDLEHWWSLYTGLGVAKRIQAPPILGVSSRAFGFDHRESLIPPFYGSRYRQLKEEVLKRDPSAGQSST